MNINYDKIIMMILNSLLEDCPWYLLDPNNIKISLQFLVQTLSSSQKLDREALLKALLSREEMMSTAIGNGIAIPHVRLFDSMSLQEDIVVVAYLFEPVDWVAPDGKPVHTLFFVLAADETRHLQILAEIAQLASDEDFVDFL